LPSSAWVYAILPAGSLPPAACHAAPRLVLHVLEYFNAEIEWTLHPGGIGVLHVALCVGARLGQEVASLR